MSTSSNEIICYDGRTFTVKVYSTIQIEARRSRRWGWFGPKGWWVHLYLFHNWHVKKFVRTLAEAGVFLKHEPDSLSWVDELQHRPPAVHTPSASFQQKSR